MVLRPEGAVLEMLEMMATLAIISLRRGTAASLVLPCGADGRPVTVVSTSPEAQDLDSIQERSGGPCELAVREGRDVRMALPAREWAELSETASGLGVHGIWAIPLSRSGSPSGALNIYAPDREPWLEPRSGTTRLVAALAGLELANATAAAELAHGNATLEEALKTRTVIGQAQGVLMAREGVGADEAFDILRRASQRTNRKLRDIAAELVAGVERPHVKEARP